MKQNIIIISLVLMAGFLLLFPVIFTEAVNGSYPTYLGLQIDALYNTNLDDPTTDVCIYPGNNLSEMTITKGAEVIDEAMTNQKIGPIEQGCDVAIFWSNLIELGPGDEYTIALKMDVKRTGGEYFDENLWYFGQVMGQDCNTVCANLDLNCSMVETQANDDTSCTMGRLFMPDAGCSDSGVGVPKPGYGYGDLRYRKEGVDASCTQSSPNFHAICTCAKKLDYTFNFIAP